METNSSQGTQGALCRGAYRSGPTTCEQEETQESKEISRILYSMQRQPELRLDERGQEEKDFFEGKKVLYRLDDRVEKEKDFCRQKRKVCICHIKLETLIDRQV